MRALLRPGGRLAFWTITVAPGLSAADHRQAVAAGPPAAAGPETAELLSKAGFADVREDDITADYLVTVRAWREARLRHRDVLRPADPEMYDDRLARGEAAREAIEAGLLRRSLCQARR